MSTNSAIQQYACKVANNVLEGCRLVKLRENINSAFPAYDVLAKTSTSRRGKVVFTLIVFPNAKGEFIEPNWS